MYKFCLAVLSVCLLGSASGCQSWSQMGQAASLQNASRVPPPGTGTFPVPKGAYNSGTAAVPTASATGSIASSMAVPTTKSAATPSQTGVVPAGFSQNPLGQIPSTSQYRADLANQATTAINNLQTGINKVEADASRVVQAGNETYNSAASVANQFTDTAPSLKPAPSGVSQSLSDSSPPSTSLNWQAPR